MFANLFSPIQLRNLELPNRFVKSASMECRANEDGSVSQSLIDHYMAMAKGGTGLITVACGGVDPKGKEFPQQVMLDKDELIPSLKEFTDAIHSTGMKAATQLHHGGRFADPRAGAVVAGPSPVRSRLMPGIVPYELEEDEIWEIIRKFGQAARRAKEAGFDTVEVHGGHNYLVHQFLSPESNRRTDPWGGTAENRFRFVKEIYQSIRGEVGDYPVMIKLNSNDLTKKGLAFEACQDIALEAARLGFDGITLSGGVVEDGFQIVRGGVPIDLFWQWKAKPLMTRLAYIAALVFMKRKVKFEEGYLLPYAGKIARRVKEETNHRVITGITGGMRAPHKMEACVRDGICDLILMARPLIAEPGFPNRLKAGDDRLPDCDNCNRCLLYINFFEPLDCYCKWPEGERRNHARDHACKGVYA